MNHSLEGAVAEGALSRALGIERNPYSEREAPVDHAAFARGQTWADHLLSFLQRAAEHHKAAAIAGAVPRNHTRRQRSRAVTSRKPTPTFDELASAEPRLAQLRAAARAVDGSDPHFCANRVWIRELKPQLLRLVGWEVEEHPLLGTEAAYDVAYHTVYDELPPCRECWCM